MGTFATIFSALSVRLLCLFVCIASAAQNFVVPWSNTQYGPDGPWQAVKITVGGNDSSLTIGAQNHADVDVLPGGAFGSMIISTNSCQPYPNTSCGAGGVWDPVLASSPTISFQPFLVDPSYGLEAVGETEIIQAITINQRSIWNASIVSATIANITNPDGSVRGVPLGNLALGADTQTQVFSLSSSIPNEAIVSWIFPGALYNQSITPSYSYGLHIGSAQFNYPGSLVFGGFNKGRVIGPVTTFSDTPPQLLDIGIGVEEGGSPFDFTNKQGLLISNTSQVGPIPVSPDPSTPYLSLTDQTCKAITGLLPVTFDIKSKYYLWNTNDPKYKAVVSSPAYLSFTFPPAPGDSANVTIKVPFALLNLTLESPIVETPVQYFPCRAFTPGSGDNLRLGRAFLQAAFLGRNWNAHTSWLAQAPGPGVGNNGLGDFNTDIQDHDLTLDTFNNASLFAQSWAMHWTVTGQANTTSVTPTAVSTSSQSSKSSSGLSTGAEAGIGIGVAAVALAALGLLILWWRGRRSQKFIETNTVAPEWGHTGQPLSPPYDLTGSKQQPPSPQELRADLPVQELRADLPVQEMPDPNDPRHR